MIQVEELFLAPDASVLEALRKLDETGQRILFIAPQGKLEAASFSCGAARRIRLPV